MGKRTGTTTKDFLIKAALPVQTETYTVISHEFIINKTEEVLKANGFNILSEYYRSNDNGSVANGIYHLNCDKDPDMGMMFAWTNSYDKSLRFRCMIGGYVYLSNNRIISNDIGTYGRVHTGSADDAIANTIEGQIVNADEFFKQLIHEKNEMKKILVPEKLRAELTGCMYFINELLTSEQLAVVKTEYRKPSFDYGVEPTSLWAMYNAILTSLHRAHPKTWMEQQRLSHYFLTNAFGIKPLAIAEAEDTIEKAQLTIFDDPNYTEGSESITLSDTLEVVAIEGIKPEEEITQTNPLPETVSSATDSVSEAADKAVENYPETMEKLGDKTIEFDPSTTMELLEEKTNPGHSNADEAAKEIAEAVHIMNSEPIPEETKPEIFELEDDTWPCLSCGKPQGPEAVFNDGQLCTECYNKLNASI
jgi:hypothetical protein